MELSPAAGQPSLRLVVTRRDPSPLPMSSCPMPGPRRGAIGPTRPTAAVNTSRSRGTTGKTAVPVYSGGLSVDNLTGTCLDPTLYWTVVCQHIACIPPKRPSRRTDS
jgi:hypothetical protein